MPVQLGERDPRRGEYLLRGGLADGDQILRNPSGTLTDGQKVEFAAVAASSAALAASRPAPTASAASAGR